MDLRFTFYNIHFIQHKYLCYSKKMKAAPLNAAHLTMMVHVTKVKVQWASQTASFWGVWQCILYETEYELKCKLL